MEDNRQVEEGSSLLDILRLLLSKIKYLILAVLVGGILGGCFAIWKTIDINHFGTRVEFYVNPEKPEESAGSSSGVAAGGSQYGVYGAYGQHVMDNMIRLLSSESFAEQLILNGKILPGKTYTVTDSTGVEKEFPWFSNNETNARFCALYEAAEPLLAEVARAEKDYNSALEIKAKAVRNANEKLRTLNQEWVPLYNGGQVKSSTFKLEEYLTYKDKHGSVPTNLEAAYDAYTIAQNDVSIEQTNVENAELAWKVAKKAAYEPQSENEKLGAVEKVLEFWRTSSAYASQLSRYKSCVSYSYLESAPTDDSDTSKLARSFIYVRISVLNKDGEKGTAIANDILTRVKNVVPVYVAENMTVPDGYVGTNCQRISRMDGIHQTDPNYTRNQAIKYGILFAALFFVVACVVVIIIDKSDKRLRDQEVITRMFNVPVLGIVPTIDELVAESAAKKKSANKTKPEVK
ncbi:MAG: hypothetical protein IJD77_00100 [Clostridia bacterium]|nr:hypothetical protein [Clostridia bacterium]